MNTLGIIGLIVGIIFIIFLIILYKTVGKFSFGTIVGAAFSAFISALILYLALDVIACFWFFKTFNVFGSLAQSFWPVLFILFIAMFWMLLVRAFRYQCALRWQSQFEKDKDRYDNR